MRVLLLLFVLLLSGGASAREFRLCVDSNEWPPYTYPDHDGLLQRLVRNAAARRGDSVTFVALPWLRCEAMPAAMRLDGLVGAPGTMSERQHFVFPAAAGRIDPKRALAEVEVVLVRRTDSPVAWDGRSLRGLRGRVLYAQGYGEIAARLQALGIPSSDDYRADGPIIKALLAGRANVAALYAEAARRHAEAGDYGGRIAIMSPALGHFLYYAAFAKGVYEADPEAVESLWRAVAELRAAQIDPGHPGAVLSR